MASHNPKLNVYILKLKNKDESVETFRDFSTLKFNEGNILDDDELFLKYFEEFLKEFGSEEFKNDKKNKKVIGISKNEEGVNYTISAHSSQFIIEGVVEGGKYGLRRDAADIDDKDGERTSIDENKAILDKFYFMLYTPFHYNVGVLLIQSYTEETVQSSFKNILKDFFGLSGYFFYPYIEPFVPKKFVETYKRSAKVKMFTYATKKVITYRENNHSEGNEFEITIQLKPKNRIDAEESTINNYLKSINNFFFQEKPLDEMNKKVFMNDSENRSTSYDVEKEMSSIKPTIYLEDVGITIDENTKLPDFEELKSYCYNLLEEIKSEVISEIEDIEEF